MISPLASSSPPPLNTGGANPAPAPTPAQAPTPVAHQGNDLDDEEDINRAILMSLQERQPTYTSMERPEPSSELVQQLTDMGFSRDRSVVSSLLFFN